MPASSRSAAASFAPTSRASGKASRGEHAIGFDLQQALQHAAGAAPAHAAIEQQEAGKAVRMDAEIGKRRRPAVGHLRTRQRIAGEMRRDRFNVRLSFGTRQQRHMRRYDQAAGQGGQPLRRQRIGCRLRERLAAGAGFEHGVAAELAVALPAQAECAAIGDEVARLRRRQLAAVAPAQFSHMRIFAFALRRFREHRQIRRPLRRLQRLVRTRMHLIVEGDTPGVAVRHLPSETAMDFLVAILHVPYSADRFREEFPRWRLRSGPPAIGPPGRSGAS